MSIFGLDHLSPTPPSPTAKAGRDAATPGSSVIPATAGAPCWWLGVHGGAGESSLAALFPMFPAAEHQWPVHRSARTRVVLVARTNHRGMSAVQAAMRDWSVSYRGHTDVLGLVLMADRPGKLPRPLRDLLHDLGGATPNLWRLPWIEELDGRRGAVVSQRSHQRGRGVACRRYRRDQSGRTGPARWLAASRQRPFLSSRRARVGPGLGSTLRWSTDSLCDAGVMDDANRGGSLAAGARDLALSGAPRRPFPAASLPVRQLQAAMRDWNDRHARHINVLGLVLVANRPSRAGKQLKELVFDVEHATRASWSMPWVDAWELGEVPSEINAPRQQVQQLTDG